MLPVRMASDLFVNLRSGFKLLVCLPMRRYDVRVSLPQVLMLAAIAAAAFVVREKLTAEPGAVFIAWNLPQPAWVVLCILFCAALVSLVQGASPVGLLTAVAALAPWVIVLAAAERWLATRWPAREQLLQIGALTLLTVAIARAIVVTAQRRKIRALVTGLALSVVLVIATVWIQLDPRLWAQEDVAAADAPEDAASVDESVLYEQPDLIAQMSEQLAPQRPGVIDLYFLGFAGDGAQQIFSREVKFAAATLANRFDLEGHTALLINNEAESETAPLATLEALKRTLQALATHMDVDEDVLFLFLSSHGSAEHELSIEYGGLPLHQLTPADVSAALDAAGIRWRIVVVSACYSGAFIDALRSDTSIVITAASADRSSFGCSDENELTYFGDAYFKQGLAATPDFSAAFDIARRAIEKREHDEQLTPSQPQIYVGSTIRKKLAQLPATDLIHARLDPSSKRASI